MIGLILLIPGSSMQEFDSFPFFQANNLMFNFHDQQQSCFYR